MERFDRRKPDEMRPVTIRPDIAAHATGSVLISFGNTEVICAATIEDRVPRWMIQQSVPGGWLTAEYSMLPYSTHDRKQRDSTRGRVDGRSTEIQRLIGRSLRAVVDLKALGQRTLWIDCDVLRADGGTRTTSINGASLAAEMAFRRLIAAGRLKESPMKQLAGAISAGVVEDHCLGPPLGLAALARVIDDERIQVGHRSEGPLREAVRREAHPLAGEPFQVAVLAHMHHRVGRELRSDPEVVGQIGVGGGQVGAVVRKAGSPA